MTTLEREPAQLLGYLEGRIEEQSVALQEVKDGQQQILARFDQMQTFMVHRMDQIHAEVNAKIDRSYTAVNDKIDQVEARVSSRIDRVFMALAGLATGIIVTQFGVIVTLLLR